MLNPRGSRAISYHFPKAYWSKSDVKLWLEMHDATSRGLYTTTNEIRAPQMLEGEYKSAKFKRYGKMWRWSNTFSKPFWILVAGFIRKNPETCNHCQARLSIIIVDCILCKRAFDLCAPCYVLSEGAGSWLCYSCAEEAE